MDLRQMIRKLRFEKNILIKSIYTSERAEERLKEYHFQHAPIFHQHNTVEKKYDLMIVLPVYNVEPYLEQCLASVFCQKTRYSFGVVAVNDGSTDSSEEILSRYHSHENLTIIHQENRGLSGARNAALKHINASYILFLDSDDYLPDDAIENLMSAAYELDADIVQGSYVEFGEKCTQRKISLTENVCRIPSRDLSGFACMKVIRAERMEDFCFPEGFLYEDTVMSKLVYPQCRTAAAIPNVVYYYRQHSQSISGGTQRANNTDTYWITKYCLEEACRRGYLLDADQYAQYLQQCWVNYIRTRYLPEEIQECIFVLTRQLYETYFPNQPAPRKERLRLLHRAFRANSYRAYRFLLERWDLFE